MEHILEGNISVKAAILAKKRKIHKIILDGNKKDKDTSFILRIAKEENIEIQIASRVEIDDIAAGKTHGGLIAICGDRTYHHLPSLLTKKHSFLALIEGVEDPFNFGYVLRTLYVAGCQGVIIPPRNWTTAAGVVAKASAGASEYIDLIIADDMHDILTHLKEHQFSLVCGLRSNHAKNLYAYTFPEKTCIAIGGELRGLSKVVQQASDQDIYIPYANDFRNAMTAASSTSIIAFEYLRQQTYK